MSVAFSLSFSSETKIRIAKLLKLLSFMLRVLEQSNSYALFLSFSQYKLYGVLLFKEENLSYEDFKIYSSF